MSKLTDDNKTWLLSFVSGQNFYNKKLKNSGDTETEYTRKLKHYCDYVKKSPDELIALKLEGLQNPATEKEFQAEELLENYLDNGGLTPNVQLGVLTAVKSFYSSTRGRDLAKDTGENIEVPEAKKRSPSVDDCIQLENAMTCRRDKFLVWFLESCPVRKGTLRKLIWKDLKPLNDKDVPYWISVESSRLKGHGKGRYKGTKHVGFLHSYAVSKLEDYKRELTEREISYNEDSPLFMCYYSNPYGSVVGGALRQFNAIFLNASIVAFGDDIKKHFSPHDFRDVISTVLQKPTVKANVNLAKPLTSHKPSGIEATYANNPDSDYLELFKMCLPYLIPETTGELKAELNQQKSENEKEKQENAKTIEAMKEEHKKDVEEQNKKKESLAFRYLNWVNKVFNHVESNSNQQEEKEDPEDSELDLYMSEAGSVLFPNETEEY
ncbi:MAG: hypothetical protein ABSD42_01900 [Candidatus Bathyarchaeia archaeon]